MFSIAGPTTSSATVGRALFGQLSSSTDAVSVTKQGQCHSAQFSVTSPGNSAPSPVCGTLDQEHSKSYN